MILKKLKNILKKEERVCPPISREEAREAVAEAAYAVIEAAVHESTREALYSAFHTEGGKS